MVFSQPHMSFSAVALRPARGGGTFFFPCPYFGVVGPLCFSCCVFFSCALEKICHEDGAVWGGLAARAFILTAWHIGILWKASNLAWVVFTRLWNRYVMKMVQCGVVLWVASNLKLCLLGLLCRPGVRSFGGVLDGHGLKLSPGLVSPSSVFGFTEYYSDRVVWLAMWLGGYAVGWLGGCFGISLAGYFVDWLAMSLAGYLGRWLAGSV